MAFNLDFSGWKAAREAQAESIINQANIAANLRAQKARNLMNAISAVGGAGIALYDQRKKKQKEIDQQVLENGLVIDPAQVASASNQIAPNGFFPDDEDRAGFLGRIFSFGGGK